MNRSCFLTFEEKVFIKPSTAGTRTRALAPDEIAKVTAKGRREGNRVPKGTALTHSVRPAMNSP